MSYTLLIWEMVPEETYLYLIPNDQISEEQWALMKQANRKLMNCNDLNEGMTFLNTALTPEEHINDDSYFDDGYTRMSDGSMQLKREPAKKEWRCIYAKYKQADDSLLENTNITRVVLSGFVL